MKREGENTTHGVYMHGHTLRLRHTHTHSSYLNVLTATDARVVPLFFASFFIVLKFAIVEYARCRPFTSCLLCDTFKCDTSHFAVLKQTLFASNVIYLIG